MISKNQLKLIQSLKLKKNRNKYALFVAEGEKVVKELLISNLKLHSVYALKEFIAENNLESDHVFEVNEKELGKISNLKSPNKVLAIFEMPENKVSDISSGLTIALDSINDPGNLGTIIRLADWFGVEKILCTMDTVDAYNPKVVMSTMGSISRVQIVYCDLKEVLSKTDKIIYGAFLEGENVYESELSEDAVLLIGNESHGISAEVEKLVSDKVNIPQFGNKHETESLNAAIATSILLSEIKSRKIRK